MAQARPKNPYKVVPIPAGYRRAYPREINSKVQRAAVRALQQCLPIGKMQATEVNGKLYMFITEGHYDDHVTKPGKPIWHPGISTVVPINQPKPVKVASQSVRDAQFINMSRMSGENDSSFEGEGFWASVKRFFSGPPLPSVKQSPLTAAQQKARDDAVATALVLSQMQGDGFYGRKSKRSLAERKALFAARRARMGEEEIDDPNFRADAFEFGAEEDLESVYAADELYDAVNGEDFELGEVSPEFGDDFGKFSFKKTFSKKNLKKGFKKAAKGSLALSTGGLSLAASKKGRKTFKRVAKKAVSRKGLAAIATGGASLALAKRNRALTGAVLTGGLSLAAKKQRAAAAARFKKRPAARPVARPVVARPVARPVAARPVARPVAARPVARPVAARPYTPPRTTATRTDSPLGPSAPFDDTVMTAQMYEQPMYEEPAYEEPAYEEPAYEEPVYEEGPSEDVEAAMDAYEAEGGEETPETADEGSDTYDETAINGEDYTHSKYSVGA